MDRPRLPRGVILVLGWVLAASGVAAPVVDPSETGSSLPASTGRGAWEIQVGRRELHVHDPSRIVRCGGAYWVFATGRGIASHWSRDLTNWQAGPRVFGTPPAWTTNAVPGFRGHYWAPDLLQLSNRFLLYYSVSTWGSRVSAIGLASSPTLDPAAPAFGWTDHGPVVRTSEADDFNAIDPGVTRGADGRLWLCFGSFWSGIQMVELDPATGLRSAPGSPPTHLAHHASIEAPAIHAHDGSYYLFVNWGLCCRGTNSTYEIRVGRSPAVTGPYVDRDGQDLRRDGGTLLLASDGPFIGPGHAGILEMDGVAWLSCHFYDGERRGTPTLAIQLLRWGADGWPVAGMGPGP